jgi:ATP-dependent DNA helicase RecQ
MKFDERHARELLARGVGRSDADFRDGQREAIRHVVEGRGRLLVVQKTGWGKSSVYFIAVKLLREQGAGPALLVSPLLALMRNQIEAAARMGVRAVTINSSNEDEWQDAVAAVLNDAADVLLVSPERFSNAVFIEQVLSKIADRVSMLVVDEAHCISDWGHDFRPDYRLIERMLRNLPPTMRVLATTATANSRVIADLGAVLGENLLVVRGDLARPSLALQTLRLPGAAERMAWLAEYLPRIPGSGIVYTLTIDDAERVAAWLCARGIDAAAYSGGMTTEERVPLERRLLAGEIKALVATSALGMGFDKPDLGFVVHYQAPGSVVTYYQQVGRAGRAVQGAYGVLLSGIEEDRVNDYFIESAFPTRTDVESLLAALDAAPLGLTRDELLTRVNLRPTRLEHALKLLGLEWPAPVAKDGSRWRRTGAPLTEAFWERAERLTALRRAEQEEMRRYIALESGHMDFLVRALDGDPVQSSPPSHGLPPLPGTTPPDLVRAAVEFVRGAAALVIEPRKLAPKVTPSVSGVSGAIAPELRAQAGRALCAIDDVGYGPLVQAGRAAGRFDDALVEACAALLGRWRPDPEPEWVTCVPSLRHPMLVADFAQRLAARLALPFRAALVVREERPAQRTMRNRAQQLRNVDGAFDVTLPAQPPRPVLLVDDLVDSGWTLTVAAALLRRAGAGPVWPLALARGGREE